MAKPARVSRPVALAIMLSLPLAASAQNTPAPSPPPPPPPPPANPAPATTAGNLQSALTQTTRDIARAEKFAQKADAEGYTQAGSLFRAVKRSHEIHKNVLEEALKKAGAAPKPDDKPPAVEVKTTKENLEAAIKAAKAAKDSTLVAWRRKASEDRNKDAEKAFRYVRESLIEHSRLMEATLDTLPQARNGKKDYFVDRVCGFLVEKLDIQKCPVCYSERDKFEKVN